MDSHPDPYVPGDNIPAWDPSTRVPVYWQDALIFSGFRPSNPQLLAGALRIWISKTPGDSGANQAPGAYSVAGEASEGSETWLAPRSAPAT